MTITARDKLDELLDQTTPGQDLDLINWGLGHMGRGGKTAIRQAVKDGRIEKRRGTDWHYIRTEAP